MGSLRAPQKRENVFLPRHHIRLQRQISGRKLHHPIKIHTISQPLPHARYQRCPQYDTFFSLPDVKSYQSAYCPRCRAQIISGRDWSMTCLMVIVAAILVLMPFAFTLPQVDIRLLDMRINASLLGGVI